MPATLSAIPDLERRKLKVAIIHYWLVGMRGGEKVLEELIRLYPQAEIFTHVADRDKLSDLIRSRPIHETFVSRLPGAKKHYQKYLGFMPRALEELDLTGFDLVISSESGPAKGVIVPPGATHVCYTHTPMRYIWDHYPAYRNRLGFLKRTYFSHLAHRLREWDVTTAARVDRFVANSRFVASRIHRYYNRSADVVHPPVDLSVFRPDPEIRERSHYLFVSELVRYKRADLVIDAFRELDAPILIVGDGEEKAELEKDLPPNAKMLGRVDMAELLRLYQGAKALIYPGEEDFGIVPVEAMACGTPVIAYARGGALDSVVDGRTGMFFKTQTVEAIRDAVERFEEVAGNFDADDISRYAEGFSAEEFRRKMDAVIDRALRDQSGRTESFSTEPLSPPVNTPTVAFRPTASS
jgi:glycosyltransferase involved in cell wall biosynthesis